MSFDKIEHFTNLIYHSKKAEYALLRKILKPIDSDDPTTDAKIYQRRIEDFVVKLLEKKGGDVFKIHKDLLNSDLEKYYNTFETMSDGTVAGSYTVLHLANSLDENNNPIGTDPYMGMSPYEYDYYIKTLAGQDERYGNEYDVEYMEDYDETGNLVYYDSSSVGQEHMRMQQLIESEDKLTKREVLTQDKLRKHVLTLFDLANKDLEDEIARGERTAEFGTKVHRTIQALLKDENDPDFNDEDRHILSGFAKLQEQAQISIQALDELLTDLNLDPNDFAHMNFNETRKKLVGGDDGGMIHQYLRFNTIKDYVDRTFKGQFEVIEALYTLAGFKINSSGHIVKLSKQEIKDNTKPAQQFLKEKKVEVLDKDNNTKIPTGGYSFMKFALKENQAYMDALLSKFRLVDPIPVQKIKLRDSILAFKKYIQDKGGIIKTEMIVHTDKILSSDLSQHIRVAGQADIVVLYPNTKTFDVYDIKTMNQYIPRSHEL
ncbi:MAG TPA: hypothetical protein PLW93_05535, partial [Candidatus Absconditabacterales bacterium]|nr:hypothetical protein [Candidatus Absconditabacterales bacterium]